MENSFTTVVDLNASIKKENFIIKSVAFCPTILASELKMYRGNYTSFNDPQPANLYENFHGGACGSGLFLLRQDGTICLIHIYEKGDIIEKKKNRFLQFFRNMRR